MIGTVRRLCGFLEVDMDIPLIERCARNRAMGRPAMLAKRTIFSYRLIPGRLG